MGSLLKVLRFIDKHFEEVILVILLALMCILMLINVILRYVFSSSIIWSDEICRYSFVVSAFFGIGYCLRTRNIMQMDSLKKLFSFKIRSMIETIVNLVLTGFFGYYAYGVVTTVQKVSKIGAETDVLRFPLWIIFAIILGCFILATIRSIQKLVLDILLLLRGDAALAKPDKGTDAVKEDTL